MTSAESTSTSQALSVSGISPEPDADVVAAITIAVLEAWPKPSAAEPAEPANTAWRFGRRRWQERAVPRRTWGARRNG